LTSLTFILYWNILFYILFFEHLDLVFIFFVVTKWVHCIKVP
jgi:hypothetical protein